MILRERNERAKFYGAFRQKTHFQSIQFVYGKKMSRAERESKFFSTFYCDLYQNKLVFDKFTFEMGGRRHFMDF